MELTENQKVLFLLLKSRGERNQEIAAILSLLTEKDIDDILNEVNKLMNQTHQLLTHQELMNIIIPILMSKSSGPENTNEE